MYVKNISSVKVHRDWAMSEFLILNFDRSLEVLFEKNKNNYHNDLDIILKIDKTGISSYELIWPNILQQIYNLIVNTQYWILENQSLVDRCILPYLPGNQYYLPGTLIGGKGIILESKNIDTISGTGWIHDILIGDKIISSYPYHDYCDLNDGIQFEKNKRLWRLC